MHFKIWMEDSNAAMNSGRRFTCVFTYSNPSNTPFSSLSFKTLRETETYLALLSRDARMRVFTTTNDPDALTNWTEHSTFLVCDPPPRGDETAFKVEFHEDTLPNWAILNAGLPNTSVGFVVAAMNTAKVYRTNCNNRFYQAAELLGHHSLIRDIAWCPGSLLGYEVIATASKDGRVRIFEVHVEGAPDLHRQILNYQPSKSAVFSNGSQDPANIPSQPSGIGAGLQGTSTPATQGLDSGTIEETVECVSTLPDQIGLQWKLKWTDAAPKMLITAGDDAEVRFWAKSDQGLYTLYGTVTRD
jgi:nucleoporin SEH1